MIFHGLRLVYRGPEHQHRWTPRCVCGWVGRHKRRRGSAEREYHAHLRAVERRGAAPSAWRRPSPSSAWPEQSAPPARTDTANGRRPGGDGAPMTPPPHVGLPLPMSAGPKAVPDT